MDQAGKRLDRTVFKRRDFASIPKGWVIVGLALAAWMLLLGIGLVAYAIMA
nr:hypothetical protein [uncultured Devosia sp.]